MLVEQLISGVVTGSLYALVGLAFVIVFRATNVINFSQGEMAMLTTYLAWTLTQHMPYAAAAVITLIGGFAFGCAVYWLMIRPLAGSSPQRMLLVVIGLFLAFSSIGSSLFGETPRPFDEPLSGPPISIAGVQVARHSIVILAVVVLALVGMFGLFNKTKVGLALRVTAESPTTAELMGIPTQRVLMLGWGLAAMAGSLAGVLIAPVITLTPSLMAFVLVAALTSIVLGGLESPAGALVGGILVGVTQNMAGTYSGDLFRLVGFHVRDSNAYRDVAVVVLLLAVLAIRPSGIFGRTAEVKF